MSMIGLCIVWDIFKRMILWQIHLFKWSGGHWEGRARGGRRGKMGEVWRWIYLASPLPSEPPLSPPSPPNSPLPSPPPLSPRRTSPSPASLHSIEADQRSKITLGRCPSKILRIEFDHFYLKMTTFFNWLVFLPKLKGTDWTIRGNMFFCKKCRKQKWFYRGAGTW